MYCYNVQPGVQIDYVTGDNTLADGSRVEEAPAKEGSGQEAATGAGAGPSEGRNGGGTQEALESKEEVAAQTGASSIIVNKNSGALHTPECSRLPKEKNRVYFGSREEAMAAGYNNPCNFCHP